jgi:hypothetical protein
VVKVINMGAYIYCHVQNISVMLLLSVLYDCLKYFEWLLTRSLYIWTIKKYIGLVILNNGTDDSSSNDANLYNYFYFVLLMLLIFSVHVLISFQHENSPSTS